MNSSVGSGVTFESYQAKSTFKSRTISASWHNDYPLYAVSTTNGVVSCYNEEGDRLDEVNLSRSCASTTVTWHPIERILCTGWKDGEIHVFYDADHSHKQVSQGNSDVSHLGNAITAMKWTPDGRRMMTADSSGVFGIWELNSRGKIVPIAFHNTNKRVTQLTNDQITFKKTEFSLNSNQNPNDVDRSAREVDSWVFFFTGDDGKLYMADDSDDYKQTAIDLKAPVASLLFHERRSALVGITLESVLVILDVSLGLRISQRSRTKINLSSKSPSSDESHSSSKKPMIQVLWVGKNLIATISNERHVRVWNLETDEHCILSNHKINEPLSYFSFNSTKRVLAAGTLSGSLFFWQFVGNTSSHQVNTADRPDERGSEEWEVYAEYTIDSPVSSISWGPGEELLAVCFEDYVCILHECILKKKMRGRLIVVQNSVDSVSIVDHQMAKDSSEIENKQNEFIPKHVKCRIKIRHLDVTDNYLAISSGRSIELYEMREGIIRVKSSIEQSSQCMALHEEGVFIGNGSRIEIFNLSGTKKQTIPFSETEGLPTHIDIQSDYIAVATKYNRVKLFQASGREAKQVSAEKRIFSDVISGTGIPSPVRVISSVRVNCNGTKIAILSRIIQNYGIQEPNTELHIYDLEQDKIDIYDFAKSMKYPTAVFWDQIEPKLFAVEAKSFGESDSATVQGEYLPTGIISTSTLFATPDNGILLQDTFPLDRNFNGLVGIAVPSLYFSVKDQKEVKSANAERRVIVSKKTDGTPNSNSSVTPPSPSASVSSGALIERRALRDFEGINIRDNKTRDALLLFSYYLTIDNMEEAYKSVKMIKDTNVWSNMAQMCVKTKKMDVAEICLGNMLDATAARALREAKESEPEIEAQIATLAIHLGLLPQAEQLYISCKRYDLLNKMYQSVGQWDKALQVVAIHDRIHLKATHYQYARYLESMGDFKGAIEHYEISNNHAYEVPRMLFDSNQLTELERYIANKVQQDDEDMENGTYHKPIPMNTFLTNSKDDTTQLVNWWAQYCEGNSNFEEAIQYYTRSNDVLSQVRLYCFSGNLKKAADIVKRSGDKSAAYHLARQLEISRRYDYAIKFYKQADAFHHAIRLAKDQDLPLEVMNLALQSTSKVMIDAAQYFEERGMMDKAVMLYQKGGRVSLAIDLCFRGQLFDVLSDIADELSNESSEGLIKMDNPADAQVLERCGDFFVQHGKYERAVNMFTKARQYVKALELCATRNVQLTEELAESLTPPKPEEKSSLEYKKRRIAILKKIAKLAAQQGNFKTSTKKYVQAGDKVKAMRVLIKSGDTERIAFFANVSRQRELYILAANYMQNLDWQKDSDILKQIISFYTKAKAWLNLSNFYEVCSQMEIDEFRNYEKALDALKDSLKYLMKEQKQGQANNSSASIMSELAERISQLQTRIFLVEKFILSRSLSNSNDTKGTTNEIVTLCEDLLGEPNIQNAIRVGDIYALLVEWYWTRKKNATDAYKTIRKMLNEEIELHYYLEQLTVQDICAAASMPMVEWGYDQDEVQQEEEIEEEIDDY